MEQDTAVVTLAAADAASIAAFVAEHYQGEPPWLTQARHQAGTLAATAALPQRAKSALRARRWEDAPVLAEGVPAVPAAPRDGIRITRGGYRSTPLPAAWTAAGVLCWNLADAVRRAPELVRQYLGQALAAEPVGDGAVGTEGAKFAALNAALWQHGVFLYVPPRVQLTEPVTVEYCIEDSAVTLYPRTLLIADRESQVRVIERYVSQEPEGAARRLLSAVVEVFAGEGARVEYNAIQDLGPSVDAVVHRAARVARDGQMSWNLGEFGAGVLAGRQFTALEGPGAEGRTTVVFFGNRAQQQEYTAITEHAAAHSQSDLFARGVMNGRARSAVTAVTHIRRGARGSHARQREETLMLSPTARAEAVPSLLIDEHDVFAAHAASAGPVEESTLHYLMSRGLPEIEAVRLVVHGFLAPVIDRLPQDAVRDLVWERVERKIRE
ncbi:MAG: Fe-S cluster assembly protein SufD [Firmicutes bacterium]|nr:Fe-S cluster assembly protein SufD [Alicyclobacillaceae bacterium]MCL6496652.1 Fe-S cluster assembly protein SufD [Bacillota bacterium]